MEALHLLNIVFIALVLSKIYHDFLWCRQYGGLGSMTKFCLMYPNVELLMSIAIININICHSVEYLQHININNCHSVEYLQHININICHSVEYLQLLGYVLVQNWLDFRLNWTSGRSQDFSSITYMYATEKYIWTPTLYVENSYVSHQARKTWSFLLTLHV